MRRAHKWWVGVAVGALMGLAEAVAGQGTEADGRNHGTSAPGEAEASSFWTALGDPALERLIELAAAGNHDVRGAAARVDGAEASRLHAALELAPIVTANAGYARRRFSSYAFPAGDASAGVGILPDQDVWDAGLTAAWEVDAFGRGRAQLRSRSAYAEAAEEDLRGTELSVSAAMASAYFKLRGLQDQLEVARDNAANQQRTLELTEVRLAAGRGTELDVERARGQLAFTLAAIPSLEAEVEAAEHHIAVLAGRSRDELVELIPTDGGAAALPRVVPAARAQEVLDRHPELSGARQRLSASRAATASARAEYLPRLSVVGTAGYTAGAVDAFGRDGTFNYSVGPVLSWAAFDLGRVKARADEARAQAVEAEARYDDAELRVLEDLAAASSRYDAGRARVEQLEASARASERAAELARARYQGGVADFLEVLDAERTLLAAQDLLAQARAAAAEAYVNLYWARGGLW